MRTPSKTARLRAEQQFRKNEIEARKASNASKAIAEYEAGLVAQREKTGRLKALREAKETAETADRAAAPVTKPASRKKSTDRA